jgi:CRP-like cAMP-binding protein
MKGKARKLTSREIKILRENYQSIRFNSDFDLVYESHVPNTGIVLIEGQIALLKRKKIQGTLEAGTLIGVQEMIDNEPVSMGCKVMGNSELILLNKSEVLTALNDRNSELYAIIMEKETV